MSEQEIIEVNKLMAEFMGMRFVPDSEDIHGGEWLPVAKHSNWCFETPPPFNLSWNWLMPVIEKIESLGYDTGICRINIKGEILSEVIISPVDTEDKHGKIEVHQRSAESKIDLTYNCINLFLNWYTDATRK